MRLTLNSKVPTSILFQNTIIYSSWMLNTELPKNITQVFFFHIAYYMNTEINNLKRIFSHII